MTRMQVGTGLPAWQLAKGVREGHWSARAVLEVFTQRVNELNPLYNAFTGTTLARAVREADAVDKRVAAGQDPGPLAGVPYSAKNLFDLEGEVTLAGSRILADLPPATQDATAVARLRAAGAVCLGATNMGEFAYDFTTQNAHYGPTRNPLDTTRSAGGSSGGSAASVLAQLCPLSLGTDTNGSMRVPASFCGIWSLKPGFGRLSRAGAYPFVDSLDTIGVFSRSVRDLAMALDAMSGSDARDPHCAGTEPTTAAVGLEKGLESARIAVLGGYFDGSAETAVRMAMAKVRAGLQVTRELELPHPEIARAAAFIITSAEGGTLHREHLLQRVEDFDPATRARFLAGALTPSTWYLQAQRFRRWWRAQMAAVFADVDVLLAPATPMLAPRLNESTFVFRGRELALGPNIGLFTQPITLIGLPVVTAPVQLPGSLPTGIQLIGRPGSEALLLQLARILELDGVCTPAQVPETNRRAVAHS